jgi:DNA primase
MKENGTYYHSQLWGSPAADYLRSRGLLHSTIERFNLGYVAKPAPGHSRYRGMVSIPYSDGQGRERGIRYRALPGRDDGIRYLATKGFSHLFAVRATDHAKVFVTEGEFDAMVLWQLGYRAVGVPGTQVWQDYMRFLFRNCEEVVLTFDNDEPKRNDRGRVINPGQAGAAKVYRSLERTGIVTRAVTLPRGQDITDAYLALGEGGLRDLLEAA